MPDELVIALASMALVVGYAAICGLLAHNPRMPLWIRWPAPLREAIAHDRCAPAYRSRRGERLVLLSPGRQIDDPDEAEALGMTATARRLRRQR